MSDGRTDRIEIRGLRVLGVHGVLPEERDRAQPFSVDLDVLLDLGAAALSDDLDRTVDYGTLLDAVSGVVSGRSFLLLEALADAVADAVLGCDGRIVAVEAVVRKVRPPVPHDLDSVGVRVRRGRD